MTCEILYQQYRQLSTEIETFLRNADDTVMETIKKLAAEAKAKVLEAAAKVKELVKAVATKVKEAATGLRSRLGF